MEPREAEDSRELVQNTLLRRVDWRFLLTQPERPRALDLASGLLSRAVRLAFDADVDAQGAASLAVLAPASRAGLKKAWEGLSPGGELYCEWRTPMIAGVWRARRRLARAGFADIQVHWPWPPPRRGSPQFWLPVDSPASLRQFLALRPPGSLAHAAVRVLGCAAVRAGILAPLCVSARRRGVRPDDSDELEMLPSPRSWVLLTGGPRSTSKIVALPFSDARPVPQEVVKFARVQDAERGLEREAAVLRALETERPEVPGVPRVLGVGRRAGRLALAETAIHGQPLLSRLNSGTFPDLALRVTRWLMELAEGKHRRARSEWWPELIEHPLEDFRRSFVTVGGPEISERARARLDGLGDLPRACEHRDCAPWNIVLTESGTPALLDWESSEPRGLPVMDLVYFLANAAFVLDGALESGRTQQAYARLLDPATSIGSVAADCLREYCGRLELDAETVARLRLLCWIVHCRSEYRRLEADAGGAPDHAAVNASVFLGLIREELRREQSQVNV